MTIDNIKKILFISMILIASFVTLEMLHTVSLMQNFSFWNLVDCAKNLVYYDSPIIGFYGIILVLEDIFRKIPIKSDSVTTTVKDQNFKICPVCKSLCEKKDVFCISCGNKLP